MNPFDTLALWQMLVSLAITAFGVLLVRRADVARPVIDFKSISAIIGIIGVTLASVGSMTFLIRAFAFIMRGLFGG